MITPQTFVCNCICDYRLEAISCAPLVRITLVTIPVITHTRGNLNLTVSTNHRAHNSNEVVPLIQWFAQTLSGLSASADVSRSPHQQPMDSEQKFPLAAGD